MALTLYAHPFSSYCQKVLIALYENAIPFSLRVVNFADPETVREFAGVWPMKRMPVLVDDGRAVMESSVIVEHLGVRHPGPVRLLPAEPEAALDVRFMDRFFDNYVMTPMGRIVFDRMRAPDTHDPQGVSEARSLLDAAYGWLEERMAGREWAAGDFSLADCAAAPSLFYADWVHPIDESFPNTRAYRQRLLARPSFARAVDEARQYRGFFPGGAPDRD
jgi:glutathione S-transferase